MDAHDAAVLDRLEQNLLKQLEGIRKLRALGEQKAPAAPRPANVIEFKRPEPKQAKWEG